MDEPANSNSVNPKFIYSKLKNLGCIGYDLGIKASLFLLHPGMKAGKPVYASYISLYKYTEKAGHLRLLVVKRGLEVDKTWTW